MMKAKIAAVVSCVMLLALVFSCASSGGSKGGGAVWGWAVNGDEANNGKSTITMTDETQEGLPAHAFKGTITHDYEYGYVNVKLRPDEATLAQLKQAKAISFRILGNSEKYAVKIATTDVKDSAYFEFQFETTNSPQTIIVPVEYFMQPAWGRKIAEAVNLDLADFVEYQYQGAPGPYEFKLWDFRVHTKNVPTEASLTPKGAAKPKAAAAEEKPIGGDLSPFEVNLTDNFQYGGNYQAIIADKRLFNGHKVVVGESFTLKITYTTSRDLEDDITVGLVDNSNSGWRTLTYKNDSKDNPIKSGENAAAVLPKSKAGETVTATLKMTAIANAGSGSAVANALVFATAGAGTKGSPGSGKLKAVKLTCTEFVFTKD